MTPSRIVPFRGFASITVCLGLLLAAPTVRAEDEVSPARALFLEGRRLATGGNYPAACSKFEESLRLEVGVGTQFNLADCWERIGRTGSAHALFLGAAASAKAAGQTEREQVLRDRAVALEVRLSRLVIETADPDPKLVIKRDDLPIGSDSWGKAVVVDPGSYVVAAKAPGKKPWQQIVKVEPGSRVVTVEVPLLEAVTPAPSSPPVAAPLETRAPVQPDVPRDRGRSSPNYKALALGGFGLASLTVGTIFAVRYRRANDDAKGICPESTGCSLKEIAEHDRLVDKATTSRSWSYVGVGVGVFAVGGAAALYFLGKQQEPARTAVRVLPVVSERGEVGLDLSAAF